MAIRAYDPIQSDDTAQVQQRIRDWSFGLKAYTTPFSGWSTTDLGDIQRALVYWTRGVSTVSALGKPAEYNPIEGDLWQVQLQFHRWTQEFAS